MEKQMIILLLLLSLLLATKGMNFADESDSCPATDFATNWRARRDDFLRIALSVGRDVGAPAEWIAQGLIKALFATVKR